MIPRSNVSPLDASMNSVEMGPRGGPVDRATLDAVEEDNGWASRASALHKEVALQRHRAAVVKWLTLSRGAYTEEEVVQV